MDMQHRHVHTGWGDESWTKVVFFDVKFILGLKSNGRCLRGCWLTIFSVVTSFFLVTAYWQWRNETHVLQIYTVASRFYSTATDGRRVARFDWGIAWTFACKTSHIEKSREFKTGDMAADPPETRIPPTVAGRFRGHRTAPNLPKGIFSSRIHILYSPYPRLPSRSSPSPLSLLLFALLLPLFLSPFPSLLLCPSSLPYPPALPISKQTGK